MSEKPRFYDITIPVREGMAVWPGDTEYAFHLGWSMAEGEAVNVGTVTMSVHTGTHADAPFHFDANGAGMGEVDLAPYIGPAVVVDVTGQNPIPWEAFKDVDFTPTPRLLLKTGAWTDYNRFPDAVPVLTIEAVEQLGKGGVLLLGVDVPSVDELDSKDLPIHHALNNAGVRILESLDLRAVSPGIYHLTALPLRLMGTDGSPVRAILEAVGRRQQVSPHP
jgi:arylformamidase